MELVLKLGKDALDSSEDMKPVLQKIADLSGFEAERYDLNSMENWRAWELELALVDSLTQRTQLFRIGGAGENLAMIALGKHGEPPTAIVRWDGDVDFDTLFEDFDVLEEAWLSNQRWQDSLAGAGVAVRVPMIAAWPANGVPEWAQGHSLEEHGAARVLDLREIQPLDRVAALAPRFAP